MTALALILALVALPTAAEPDAEPPQNPARYRLMGINSFSDGMWLLEPASSLRDGDRVTYSRATVFARGASTHNGRAVAYVISRAVMDCAAGTGSWGVVERHAETGEVWDRQTWPEMRTLGGGGDEQIYAALCGGEWPATEEIFTEAEFLTEARARLAR